MSDDLIFIPQDFYGHVVLESRMRQEGNKFIGEGRALHYDRDGRLVEDTGWEPTGCVMILPEPDRRPWWKLW